MRETDIYRAALEKWGADAQTLMVFEEMAELEKELCKNARGKDNRGSIAEEIADVQIMLEQMIVLHNCRAMVRTYMFQMRDKFGGTSQLLDNMKADTREGFSIACEAAALLAEQGELVRRNFGYDPEPILDASTIAATAAPSEIVALKLAIPAAISLGYGREVEPENDEVDLGLAELNTQKKTK